MSSPYVGDFRTGVTIRKMWNSFAVAGESITRATNGTISVYKDGGTTQSTTGVTLLDLLSVAMMVAGMFLAETTQRLGPTYSAMTKSLLVNNKVISRERMLFRTMSPSRLFCCERFAPHDIFFAGYRLKMCRINARTIAALVIDFKANRDWANKEFVGNTVGQSCQTTFSDRSLTAIETSVAVSLSRSEPRPTGFISCGLIHESPESDMLRNGFSHEVIICTRF